MFGSFFGERGGEETRYLDENCLNTTRPFDCLQSNKKLDNFFNSF